MSNITEEIEKLSGIMSKLGEAHNMLAKTSLSKEEYQPISNLLASAKVELFNFYNDHKAALQNKVSDINECYFTPNKISTSATICANCGKEKFLHTIGQGIKATKTIYQSDVSAEEYINKKQLQFNPYTSEGVITKQGLIKHLEEYVSIVNERKDNIPADFKQITGHNSPKEYVAYEKGREDEQEVIMKWIEEWDGSSNSVMGALLKKKFNELFTYLSKQTNSHKLKNKTEW